MNDVYRKKNKKRFTAELRQRGEREGSYKLFWTLYFQKHKVSEIETTWLAQTLHHVQVIPEPEKKGEIFSGNKAILLLKILS